MDSSVNDRGVGWLGPRRRPAEGSGTVTFPQGRTAYFVGEKVLMAVTGPAGRPSPWTWSIRDGRIAAYRGKAGALLLDTSRLAPGQYGIAIDGVSAAGAPAVPHADRAALGGLAPGRVFPAGRTVLHARRSQGPGTAARKLREHRDEVAQRLQEIGLTACMSMMSAGMGQRPIFDTAARSRHHVAGQSRRRGPRAFARSTSIRSSGTA